MYENSPLRDFAELAAGLPAGDAEAANRMRSIFAQAKRERFSLGRVEDIAAWLAMWSGKAPPAINRPLVAIFAGTHGFAAGLPAEDETVRNVESVAAGTAPVNQFCAAYDLGLKVFDLALEMPTGDFAQGAAMDERTCAATIAFGMEAIAGGTDFLCLGDFGGPAEIAAAAIFAALYGGEAVEWLPDAPESRKAAAAIEAALALHGEGMAGRPLEVLRRLGGREFAALAGAILAARTQHIPVLLDGSAALAAAAIAAALGAPEAVGHCLLAHAPASMATKAAARIGFGRPLLDLGITHGGGTGAALAAGLVKASAQCASGLAATL